MEDLPIGSEIVLKVVKTEKEQCNGCFFDEICNKQLQDVYDEEGDMEIAIKIDDNDLGSEPIVVKSTVYEQLYIVNS